MYGNQLDQDGNFVPGETPGDQFTVSFSTPGPMIISSTPTGNVGASVDHVRVTFDTPMDPSSFTPDKVSSFIGPSGQDITVTSVAVVPFTNNKQFDVHFAQQTTLAAYTMVIGPKIQDIYGNQMDQDNNLVPGEMPGDQYTVHFTLFTANLIANGDFEAGGTGWSVLNQTNSSGSWFLQTGTTSPASGFVVPPPPDQGHAAMTDGTGPGSHVLFQDFVVPAGITTAILSFDRFIGNRAASFITPDTLDYTRVANQQARVDILTTKANLFSVAASDVLMSIFKTKPSDPSVSGYTTQTTDLTAFLAAHGGETLRLRFAEVDNQFNFQFGVDRISLAVNSSGGGVAAPSRGMASPGRFGSISASAEFGPGAALLLGSSSAEAALGLHATPLPSPSLTSILSAAETVRDQWNVKEIDRFFSSTGKEKADHALTPGRSEQLELALAGPWQEDAVTALFGNACVPS